MKMQLAIAAAGSGIVIAWALAARLRRRRRALLVAIDPSRHGPPPLPLAAPEDVGLSSERLHQISAWSDGWVASGKFPGLLTLIARRGKLCYLHASGLADVESGSEIAQNTVMRLYSLSKPLVSACAMVLYEQCYFQLDEPISHHLPSFANPRVLLPSGETVPARREITVRDLLTHTAGLTYGDSDSDVDAAYKNAGCGWDAPYRLSLSDFVDRVGRLPLAFHPGESWRYSYATDVLGRLLEVLSGEALDALLHRTLFAPLGMHDSGFVVTAAQRPRFAEIYEAAEVEGVSVGAAAKERRRFERHGSYAGLLSKLQREEGSVESSSRSASSDEPRTAAATASGRLRVAVHVAVVSCAARPGALDKATLPKVLMLVAGETVLSHVLRQLQRAGITRVVLVLGARGQLIRDALDSMPIAKQLQITLVDLGATYARGFASSLLAASEAVGSEDRMLLFQIPSGSV